ncbi:MAG: hypothetical protein M0017_09050 [Desulfobacteraceae bacterium]|nr:hypothetical protein [Desulfobacteraceae bacterium]
MFLNSWSLALTLVSLIVLVLTAVAVRTAVRVLRFWDPGSDDNRQIRLESETWLASTLVEYGLGFQIVSLALFALAADHFCKVISGAMCATGALNANAFGMPALLIKLAGVFLYGFWIVLHQLDISSESYPLVRVKYAYLLLLLPLLLCDVALQTLYIGHLVPDIITSCCAVVFSAARGEGHNLLATLDQTAVLRAFYASGFVLAAIGLVLRRRRPAFLLWLYAGGWAWFLCLSLVAIIVAISSYIYAMPFHRCPFCILKPEYHYIGFALYATLLLGSFFGMAGALVGPFRGRPGLAPAVERFQKMAVWSSLLLLAIFVAISSYHYLLYRILGGES